ncbi:MAG: TerC family protein [Candidatus Kapabacteria bacterium]|nr:TerC family protein [Candidatus Kapabacteria bacterium]
MEHLFSAEGLIALVTLTVLEIVLGIDNLIFVSILAGKLPADQQQRARTIGLSLAMILRVAFLFAATWIAQATVPLFEIGPFAGMTEAFGVTGRDLIMAAGGLFLLAKATTELHGKLEGSEHETSSGKAISYSAVIVQIILLDLVFSIDSVITAIGLAQDLTIMVIAVVVAVVVMQASAATISGFIHRHPTIKVLALAFLLMIGMLLTVEALHVHVPKGYVYFAMAFSVGVELLNIRIRARAARPVELRSPGYQSSTSEK